MYYVSKYEEVQVYGGSEEGGWWYVNRYFVCCMGTRETLKEARAFADQCRKEAEAANKTLHEECTKNFANMPEEESPYLDTEGYIPTGWAGDEKYVFFAEETLKKFERVGTRHYE